MLSLFVSGKYSRNWHIKWAKFFDIFGKKQPIMLKTTPLTLVND
jgi:hypothetical protein